MMNRVHLGRRRRRRGAHNNNTTARNDGKNNGVEEGNETTAAEQIVVTDKSEARSLIPPHLKIPEINIGAGIHLYHSHHLRRHRTISAWWSGIRHVTWSCGGGGARLS